MNYIQRKYRDTALKRGDMWLYFISDAVRVVTECKERNIKLSGIDAFSLSGKGIQPSMNNSLWFNDHSEENYQKAIDFLLQEENKPFLYEIWYEGY